MRKRLVIVSASSILELMKDYLTEEYVPTDARIVKLMVKPTEMGRFALVAESPEWTNDTPIQVHFDIRRIYSVGGGQ